MNDILQYKDQLERRLKKLYSRQVIISFVGVLILTLTFAMIFFSGSVIIEFISRMDSDSRETIVYAAGFLTVAAFLIYFGRILVVRLHLLNGPVYEELAELVGNKFPDVKDELKNAYQIINNSRKGISKELTNAAFKAAFDKTRNLDFYSAIELSELKKKIKFFLITLAAVVLLSFLPFFNSAAVRIINYDQEYTLPPKYSFMVEPGNILLTKGEPVNIKVKLSETAADELSLHVKSDEDYQFRELLLAPDSAGVFRYSLKAVLSSFRYYCEYDGVKSNIFEVQIIDRPSVSGLDYEIIPPSYTRLPKTIQKDNGNITGLPGTNVKIKLYSEKALAAALIKWQDSSETSMLIDSIGAIGSFRIKKEMDYLFEITDTSGIKNSNPIVYSVNILQDEKPFIEFVFPRKDITLGETDIVPLLIKISDDYGFSGLSLFYKLSRSQFKRIDSVYRETKIPFIADASEKDVAYAWDLSGLSLAENDVVSFYAEVEDNDFISGPKRAVTKILNLRVPSLDELFAKADKTQEKSTDDLEEALKESEKLKEEMTKLSNELKRDDKKIDWQEKENIQSAMKKMKELQKKVSDVAEKLKKMEKELSENKLLSQETLEKYNELQKLFEELNGEELQKALERMQNMMNDMMRDKIQQSLQDMQFNEEMFRKSMERTINLLKRIQVEQKLDEVMKRTADIEKKQKEIKEEQQKSSSDENKEENLAKRQDEINKELKNLGREMENLKDKMNELEDMPNDMMKQIKEEFDKQENDKLSEKAKSKIEKKDFQSAEKMQNQLMSNMKEMEGKLSEMKSQMQMQNQLKTMAEMMRIINELVDLSKQEEKLKNETRGLSGNSPKLGDKAREQNEMISALGRIVSKAVELSQKTFAITPEMGKALGMSRIEMAQAISALQNRNSSMGVNHQTGAMRYLNDAAQQMQNAMASMMNPGKGGGMMSLMQQMQKLGQQQMNLNQLTKMMQSGKLTQQQMAQMKRLANRQKMIQQSLEELNKEVQKSGESKKLTANLRKIIEDMKEVVAGMNSVKIDDKLIHKQDKILSRLLDAQRSINERDFEKNRESVAGKEFSLNSPPELLLRSEEGRNKLRDALLKAVKEGYSKDYEELIRKYFKALEDSYKFEN